MPGMVATVAVKPGDEVERGDMLLSIEAMKMEAGVRAERDGRIAKCSCSAASRSTRKIC